MKKLLLLASLMVSISTFAAPWDINVPEKKAVVFRVPTLTDFTVSEQSFPHRAVVYFKMNQAASYTQLMTVMIFGYWADINDYEPRTFDIIIPPGQTERTVYYTLAPYDDLHPEMYDIYYLGPL